MEPRTLEALQLAVQRGDKLKYLFFWGHTPRAKGRVGKECLSQWWSTSFVVGGIVYRTAEHFMMAEKARLFDDESTLDEILHARHPNAAKRLGRTVRNFDPAIWDDACFRIVVEGNAAKFSQNAAERRFLLATGHRVLVEASPRDAVWGIGLAEHDERARSPAHWRGQNLLGFALMEVRAQLAAKD